MANFDNKISTEIKLISQCFVKPKYEVEASKQPHYLGLLDLVFLTGQNVQKGLLFSTKPENIQSEFLETLKHCLAISLVHFYPLAGRFSTQEFPEENAKWVYLDCNKGLGALLVHASVDYNVSDILSSVDVHPIVTSFFELGEKSINIDGHTRPLLSIQVTELIDGIFIGFSMNHAVVDGHSQWHFINSLSEIFLNLTNKNNSNNHENDNIFTISRNPIFKPYFPDGYGPIIKLPNINKSIAQSNDEVVLRERIFHFSPELIRKLKVKANEQCGVDNISSFQALSAFIWRSITRARNLQPELDTCCDVAMNVRSRFSPPISNDYFGMLLMKPRSMCKVGDLLNKDLGWTAMLIHQLIVSQDDKKVREFYESVAKFLCEGPKDTGTSTSTSTGSPSMVTIGGSARFDMYGPEFGFGKAEAILAGYCGKYDGKVTASPGREGGGSVDLEICLKPETMNALESDEEFISFVTLNCGEK